MPYFYVILCTNYIIFWYHYRVEIIVGHSCSENHYFTISSSKHCNAHYITTSPLSSHPILFHSFSIVILIISFFQGCDYKYYGRALCNWSHRPDFREIMSRCLIKQAWQGMFALFECCFYCCSIVVWCTSSEDSGRIRWLGWTRWHSSPLQCTC